MGHLYLQLLTDSHKHSMPRLNEQVCIFKELPTEWPSVSVVTDSESAVHCFKLANTQFNRAIKVFVIDGYVTEHVKISQEQSKLYKQLAIYEKDSTRLMALVQRRADLLEPLRQMLNPNSYYNLLQEMSAELSEIYSNKFELISELI
jgi:hypothetical protein